MKIQEFYDKDTAAFSYIVADEKTGKAAIIDSVLNFNHYSGRVSHESADELIDYLTQENLELQWILETHIHADHITAASYLKEKFPSAKIAISEKIVDVLKYWAPIFNLDEKEMHFDHLFSDGEKFKIGELQVETIQTLGHTPSCLCYKIEDAIFVGDVIFMPDIGTARADFPGGSAEDSYDSLQKILSFPDETKLYTAHDYPPEGRELSCFATVFEQKEKNVLINKNVSKDGFIKMRKLRDEKKPAPRLLMPSLQANIYAGKLPEKEENGVSYIKIPLNKF